MLQPSLCVTQRFGLGVKASESAGSIGDPRGRLLSQIDGARSAPVQFQALRSSREALVRFDEYRIVRKDYLKAVANKDVQTVEALKATPVIAESHLQFFERELKARIDVAIETDAPLVERLAMHWANVLTVSVRNGKVVPVAGAYEREAIRPHLFGNFADMLTAAVLHPAMLIYLDGRNSVGPNSRVGRGRAGRGLNENLGREILELHTLGVNGGYTQQDVIELSKILTGWSVRTDGTAADSPTLVAFDPARHEPGERTLLGKRYPEAGADQVRIALADLARHPATAEHLARRLASHFVGTPPPPALVASLAKAYRDSDGSLMAMTKALIAHDSVWEEPVRKVRSPIEFLLATSRTLGVSPPRPKPMLALKAMGQPYFQAAAPIGWPEEDDVWAAPDAIKTRVDWTIQLVRGLPDALDARRLAEASFADALSRETRGAIAGAASGAQGLTLFLMSPEFQRR